MAWSPPKFRKYDAEKERTYDAENFKLYSAETKGIERVQKSQRASLQRTQPNNFRLVERMETMRLGLLRGKDVRLTLNTETAYIDSQKTKKGNKLKPLKPDGKMHVMNDRQRMQEPPENRTIPWWTSNNCWWQSALETLRRAYEFLEITVPKLDKANSMLGKSLALMNSGDISLESSPCRIIEEGMWAVAAHKTGVFNSFTRVLDALSELTVEDSLLHSACTTEWIEGDTGKIGAFQITLEQTKESSFMTRFDSRMKKEGVKKLPSMIFVDFPDSNTHPIKLDDTHKIEVELECNFPGSKTLPLKLGDNQKAVEKAKCYEAEGKYRIVAYIFTNGSHFFPVVLRGSKLYSADGNENAGVLQQCVKYAKEVHESSLEDVMDNENETTTELVVREKKINETLNICENVYVNENGHPALVSSMSNYCLCSYVYVRSDYEMLQRQIQKAKDKEKKKLKVDDKGTEGGQRREMRSTFVNAAFDRSPALSLRYTALKQHVDWNEQEIVQSTRLLQHNKTSLTAKGGFDVEARLDSARKEREILERVVKTAHEILGFKDTTKVLKPKTKHECCVCTPLQVPRFGSKRRLSRPYQNSFPHPPNLPITIS